MKVAICSSDGARVDTHFGKTTAFYIYDFKNQQKVVEEVRRVDKYSPIKKEFLEGSNQHPFLKERFDDLYNSIKDCEVVYTASIGEIPRRKLEELGIQVEECVCAIDWIRTEKPVSQSSRNKYFLS